ncbi:hypothetical protein J6590_027589 [Homalodisca vitripennis]|nr:hypothetical protein J6590_027589 [Homalodisca vitripennis]
MAHGNGRGNDTFTTNPSTWNDTFTTTAPTWNDMSTDIFLESKLTSTQCKLASSEAKIEELTEEEDKHNRRIESLTQELAELQSQIQKEKQKNLEIQNIFEDYDQKQEHLIEDQSIKIKNLETQISLLNTNAIHLKDSGKLETRSKVETGTQTAECLASPETKLKTPPNIVLELAQMKSRQDSLETTITRLNDQLNSQPNVSQRPVLHEQSTQTATIPTQTTSRYPKSTPKTFVNSSLHSTRKIQQKQINHMTISLQTAKYAASQIKNHPIPCNNFQTLDTLKFDTANLQPRTVEDNLLPLSKETPPLEKRPPYTATKLGPKETIEEFYNTNIEQFKANYLINHSNNNSSPSFLLNGSHRKERT